MSDAALKRDFITIADLLKVIARNLHWILLSAAIFTGLGYYYSKTAARSYTADMVIIASDYYSSQGNSGARQIPGLPFSIQVGQEPQDVQKLKTILQTDTLAETLLANGIDDWLLEEYQVHEIDNHWFGRVELPPVKQRQISEIRGRAASITFSPVPDTDAIKISYADKNRDHALRFLSEVIRAADEQLKAKTLSKINNDIAFLRQQLSKTTMLQQQDQLRAMMAERLSQKMIISRPGPFTIETVTSPQVSNVPTWPQPRLILLASFVIGSLLGLLTVFLIFAARRG